MKIEEIIFILENKLKTLEQQRSCAVLNGDLEAVVLIDNQINDTTVTLTLIKKPE
jgi:hypothetical protein